MGTIFIDGSFVGQPRVGVLGFGGEEFGVAVMVQRWSIEARAELTEGVGWGRTMATMAGGGVPDLQSLVASLDAALLPCLPARELQAADRSTHPTHQVDVESHAADFMEAAKTLQLYFIRAQHQHQPSRQEALRKEIAALEAELKVKDALMEKQSKLLQHWQGLLEAHKNTHIEELERV